MTQHGLGYLEDKEDEKDYLLSSVLGDEPAPPASDSHLEKHVTNVLSQGGMEACVGYGVAQAARTLLSLQGHDPILPSAGFIWWNSRKTHGDELVNGGTYMRSALKTTNTLGICADRHWPSSKLPQTFDLKPSRMAYREAYDARFDIKYYRITGSGSERIDQIKRAVSQKSTPLLIGLTVSKAFTKLGAHSAVAPPKGDEQIAGGHALCAVSYDEAGLKGPNSWGYWGNRGWYHVSWDYITSLYAKDIWALTMMPPLKG